MKSFGYNIIGRAVYDVTFSEMMRPFAHALAVVHAAHGAEILVKARIAEEHPLLIFPKLPTPSSTDSQLTVEELLEYAKSVEYSELPNLLWATTGYRIKDPSAFLRFGKLRNQITHFAIPNKELSEETLRFIVTVLDPMLCEFWNKSAIPYASQWDEVTISEGYLEQKLNHLNIPISPTLRRILDSEIEG